MSTEAISRLTKYLIAVASNHSVSARPAVQTPVSVFFVIIKTLLLSPTGILEVSGGLILSWTDTRLSWNPAMYEYQKMISIPSDHVWTPELMLVNSARQKFLIGGDSKTTVLVTAGGLVKWLVPRHTVTSCALNLAKFPFDTQICSLTYAINQGGNFPDPPVYSLIDSQIPNSVSQSGYVNTGEFSLTNAFINSSGNAPGICLQRGKDCFPSFSIILSYSRQRTYYIYNVVVPAFLLTLLVPFAFFIPSENNVKITMTCSLMVALYVLQQNSSRLMPAGSKNTNLSSGNIASLVIGCIAVIGAVMSATMRLHMPAMAACCVTFVQRLCGSYKAAGAPTLTATTNTATAFDIVHSNEPLFKKVSKLGIIIQNSVTQDEATSTSETAQLLRKMVTLLDRMATVQQVKANEVAKANEKTYYWKNFDRIVNIFVFICLIVSGTMLMIYYDLSYLFN